MARRASNTPASLLPASLLPCFLLPCFPASLLPLLPLPVARLAALSPEARSGTAGDGAGVQCGAGAGYGGVVYPGACPGGMPPGVPHHPVPCHGTTLNTGSGTPAVPERASGLKGARRVRVGRGATRQSRVALLYPRPFSSGRPFPAKPGTANDWIGSRSGPPWAALNVQDLVGLS